MRQGVVYALALAVLLAALASAVGMLVDLSGWWTVIDDNGHFIRITQEGADVTIWDGDGTFLASGFFSNDSLFLYITDPVPDTAVWLYANDTLYGQNNEGEPRTLVRYEVDLNGLWKILEYNKFLIMHQQGSDVDFWEVDLTDWHMDSAYVTDGVFANDTLQIFLEPPDVMILVYAADTLRGDDLEGSPNTLVRAPDGPWSYIRCGTIAVDGYAEDWPEEYLVADDPDNDGTGDPSAELDRLYLCRDSMYLYFRLDCVGDAGFPNYGDRYVILLGRNIIQQSDYEIRIWDTYAIIFRNSNTGEETTLEAPGMMGRTIEGRVPLYLLEGIENADVEAQSAYYDWEFGWQYYDRILTLAKESPCVCGDADGTMAVNIGDAVYLINFIFKGGAPPAPLVAGDANCDTAVNIGDAVYLINFIFKGGPEPCCP